MNKYLLNFSILNLESRADDNTHFNIFVKKSKQQFKVDEPAAVPIELIRRLVGWMIDWYDMSPGFKIQEV